MAFNICVGTSYHNNGENASMSLKGGKNAII